MKENNKIKNVDVDTSCNSQSKHTRKIMSKRKKAIIVITIIAILIILLCMILLKRNNTNKIEQIKLKQEEAEPIGIEISIKNKTDEKYNCLLTFTSTDENNKIKQIEYPSQEGKEPKVITIANEDGKDKIAVDYEFEKEDINKIFKVKTVRGDIISKRTAYTITYDANSGINPPKEDKMFIGNSKILSEEQPTKEGYVFWGWSEDKNGTKPEYLKKDEFINTDKKEDIKLYAIWEDENNGIIRYIAKQEVNNSGIYTTTALGVEYNLEVTYLTPSNIESYGGTYDLASNTYTLNDLNLGTAQGIQINEQNKQAMAVLKCEGNLIINGKITTRAYSTTNSGVTGDVTKIKGMCIYCTGKLTNNGEITQTARGTCDTKGENVYLWPENSSYEGYTVPAVGASGGLRLWQGR